MRHFYTITPAVVYRRANQALASSLDWKGYKKSVSVGQVVDMLLLMASLASSLFAVVRRFFPFSHQTATLALKANMPDRAKLTGGLVNALYDIAQFSRQDQRRRWLVAIDTNNLPYYGKPTPDVVGGPKKQGTKWFFAYATAVLLHKRRRYTIALKSVSPRAKPHELVRDLLDQITGKGLKIKGVTLDSGFESGETLLLLQERNLAYSVPLRRKGKGRNARNQCFEGSHGAIGLLKWKTKITHCPVQTRTLLWKGRARTMLFAFGGWTGNRARSVHQQAEYSRQVYRRRFGIETSYRQKNQAHAWTTSTDPVYRLLLEGLAYLLRQVWVVLTEELARAMKARPNAWIANLTLQKMVEWLVDELKRLYPENHEITVKIAGLQG
jgi:hypothetical protein